MKFLKLNKSGAITIPKDYRKKFKKLLGFLFNEKENYVLLKPVIPSEGTVGKEG